MQVDLDNRVAIVTGAGRGLGEAIAKKLADCGASVVVNDIESEPAMETVSAIANRDGEATSLVTDVRSEQEVEEMVNEVEAIYGTVDILINNAGVGEAKPFFMKPEDDVWELQLDTNLWGSIYCIKHTFESMKKQNYGKIVNITSVHTKNGVGFAAQYDVAKFGLLGLTKNLALELGRFGIRVNAVAPGHLNTRMTEDFSEKRRNQILDLNPLDKFGDPDEIADSVAFLSSPASDYINGHELRVDGGQAPIDSFKKL